MGKQALGAIKRQTVTVEEAAKLLGIGRASGYACAHTGRILSVRVGRRILVLLAPLESLLAGDPEAVARYEQRSTQL